MGSVFTNARQFWMAQQGWARSKGPDLLLKAKSLGLTLPANPEAEKLMIRTRSGVAPKPRAAPGQLITVDPRINDWVFRMMEAVAPKLATAMEKHLVKLAFDAAREWPTETGLSRALLRLEFKANAPFFVASFISGAPYTRFISGQPFRNLIDAPGRAVAVAIGNECVDELAKARDV